MGGRDRVAGCLRPGGHPREGKHEARQQERGKDREETDLHRLRLRPRNRRDEKAERKVRQDVEIEAREEGEGTAEKRRVEQDPGRQQEYHCLKISHHDTGQDLPHHHFEGPDRGWRSESPSCPVHSPARSHGRDEDHRQRQHDPEEPGHDVDRSPALGIELAVNDLLEGRRHSRREPRRTFERLGHGRIDDPAERRDGSARPPRIGRVDRKQKLHDGHGERSFLVMLIASRPGWRARAVSKAYPVCLRADLMSPVVRTGEASISAASSMAATRWSDATS